jgi:hypothetical protein
VELLGQEKRYYVEVFVVPGSQPTGIFFGLSESVNIAQGQLRLNEVLGGELGNGGAGHCY